MRHQNFVKKRAFAFRQWTRKSYAVFNSLKLLIKISVMSVAYTIVNPVQKTQAQSDTTQSIKKIELDEVEVGGQRTPVVYSQLARVVSVVTRSEIEQAPVLSANDLLKYIPQVDIRQRGVNGVQADISIQGGSFDQTLILLNGINLTDPQTGHYNLNLPINLESIDRIEILKGPASRVYGANAFSGAVNFITGQNQNNQIKASLTGGDFGLYQGALSVNQHSHKFHNFLSVSKNKSDGYIHNTDYNLSNVYYYGKALINKQSQIGLQFGYAQKKYGANNFYSPKYANQFENTNTYFGSINAETGEKIKLTPSLYWRRNYDHYLLDYTNPNGYQNFHYTDVWGSGINSNFQTLFGKTSIGIDYRKEIIFSTNLGYPLDHSKKIPGEDSIRYTKRDTRENISLYFEHNIYFNHFSASTGLMANHNTKLSGIEFYPGVDMSYQIKSPIKWYASFNRSLRMPSFTDLYYKGPQNRGNPYLKPEQALTVESGFKLSNKGVKGNLSYFHRWGTNIIDWIKYPNPDSIWFTTNYTKLNTNGIEFSLTIKPRDIIASAFFVDEVNLSYSFTSISKKKTEFDSYYALDNLKNKVVVCLIHSIWKKLGAMWCLTWQDRNGIFNKYDPDTKTSVETPYKPFFLFDGKIYWKTRIIKLFLEATNVFNVNYFDIGNIAQPGRWFKGGIEVNVGWK